MCFAASFLMSSNVNFCAFSSCGVVRHSLDHTSQIDSPRSWFEPGLSEYGTDRFLTRQFAMGVASQLILLLCF
jgi:hypothetical protein